MPNDLWALEVPIADQGFQQVTLNGFRNVLIRAFLGQTRTEDVEEIDLMSSR